MLTLSLFRHAKSSWDNQDLEDFDRPLNDRGKGAAPLMGKFMAEEGIVPDLILCSPAVRARQTLELALPHFRSEPTVNYEDDLYLTASSTLLKRIRKLEANVHHAMIVGHDPGLHRLAIELTGSGDPELLQALTRKFPTAGLAVIQFDVTAWSKVKPGTGRLRLFMTPKRLP
jgi:phosphohistidine phosphatase